MQLPRGSGSVVHHHHPHLHPHHSTRSVRPLAGVLVTITGLALLGATLLLSSSVPSPPSWPSQGAEAVIDGRPPAPQLLRGLAAPNPNVQPRYEAQAFGDTGSTSVMRWWWERHLARTVLLVVASSDRPEYLKRCLAAVARHFPPSAGIPVLVSEDGESPAVRDAVAAFRREVDGRTPVVVHVHHPQLEGGDGNGDGAAGQGGLLSWQRLLGGGGSGGADVNNSSGRSKRQNDGYHRLARHYRWALDQAFAMHAAPHTERDKVVVLEEDLEVSPDFWAYFGSLAPLLNSNESSKETEGLMAISAWHDNGMADRVVSAPAVNSTAPPPPSTGAVHRTDFFPGLGWMLARGLWEGELAAKWPDAYWDDWLRAPAQRRGRHFLRPEVSRTHHFGRRGTSNGQFSPLLERNRLSGVPVAAWADEEGVRAGLLEEVATAAAYDRALGARVAAAEEVGWMDLQRRLLSLREGESSLPEPSSSSNSSRDGGSRAIRLTYTALEDGGLTFAPSFPRLAAALGLFDDLKSGVPRAGYRGVVATYLPRPVDERVFLVPEDWRERLLLGG